MSLREWMLAAVLAAGGASIVIGVAEFSNGAAWIVGGVLLVVLGWLVLADGETPG